MQIADLSSSSFDGTVDRDGIVIVDCWAPWCQTCKAFAPVFATAAEQHPRHVFARVDTGTEPELTGRLGLEHVPTLLVFRDGILLSRQPGSLDAEGLGDVIAQAEALDMEEVRAHLATESGSEARRTS